VRRIALLSVLAACACVQAQNKQDLVYDALTGNFYRLRADNTLTTFHGRPNVPHDGSVQWHVINTNPYKATPVIAQTREVMLYRQQPTGFSFGALVASVFSPNTQQAIKNFGVAFKGTTSLETRLDNLKTTVDRFNAQCAGFKELANLDGGIKSIAAYGAEIVPVAGAKDPREPGRLATAHLKDRLKSYVAQLFQTSGVSEVQQKGTMIEGGSLPSADDLVDLASSKASAIKQSFSAIQQQYSDLSSELGIRADVATKSTESTAAAQGPEISQAARALQDELDQSLAQARQNVTAIDADAAARNARLQSATRVYREMQKSDNLFQWDDSRVNVAASHGSADAVVFSIDFVDNDTPPPPPIAQSVIDGSLGEALQAETGLMSKGTTPKPSLGGTKPKQQGQPGQFPYPKQDQGGAVPASHGEEVPVYLTGKLKVDFSSGLFLSNVTDHNYNATPSGGGALKVTKGSNNQFTPSVGGLAHVYITSSADFIPALSFGLGLAQNGNPQYFLGGSIITGHSSRFILTAGLAGGLVQRLDGVNVGSKLLSNIVPLRNVFRSGMFVGLTYNLAP
jgi:hypothetical protein